MADPKVELMKGGDAVLWLTQKVELMKGGDAVLWLQNLHHIRQTQALLARQRNTFHKGITQEPHSFKFTELLQDEKQCRVLLTK